MHARVQAVKTEASFLVGNPYASTAYVPFCTTGFLYYLVPFLDQAFIEKVLKVFKGGIYVPLYFLLGLIEILHKLFAMRACTRLKSIILQLECVEEKLRDFLLFAEIRLVYYRLEESYVRDSEFSVTAGVLGELFLDLVQRVDCSGRSFLV